MSLTQTSLVDVVKKQYVFKLKAYLPAFGTLVGIQLLAIFFSFGGVANMGTGNGDIEMNVTLYSADIVIVFTLLWAFITGILLTTKAYRYDDFAFVTNRVSSHLANVMFLVTASIIGGVCAILCRFPLKVYTYYFVNSEYINLTSQSALELWMGILTTILYVLLLGAMGYFIGMLVQLNRLFIVVIPAVLIGTTMFGLNILGREFVVETVNFFVKETSFSLFFVKVLVLEGYFHRFYRFIKPIGG